MTKDSFEIYSSPLITNILEINNEIEFLRNKTFIVWRSGGLARNKYRNRQPKTYIQLREFNQSSQRVIRKNRKYIKVNCQDHALFRTGTVWDFDNEANAKAILIKNLALKTFDVDFSSSRGWEYHSIQLQQANEVPSLIPPDKYTGDSDFNKFSKNNWMVCFNTKNDLKVLVPCMEIFSRIYGQSSQFRRDVLTLSFSALETKYYPSYDKKLHIPEAWNIKLAKYTRIGDGIFLAYLKYDNYVKNIVKNLSAQLQINYNDTEPCFIKIPPWFSGKGQITVSGTYLKKTNCFLVARLEGVGFPASNTPINIILDNRKKVDKNDDDAGDEQQSSIKNISNDESFNEDFPLSQDSDSDHASNSKEIVSDPMIWSNLPKMTVTKNDVRIGLSTNDIYKFDESSEVSTDAPYGGNTNTSQAEIVTHVIIDSKGTITDTWNALRIMKNKFPDKIINVESYSFSNGWSDNSVPVLLPFPKSQDAEKESIWNYTIPYTKRRGILFIRVKLNNDVIYVIEISRKFDEIEQKETDSFCGLVFRLKSEEYLEGFINKMLVNIQKTQGKFKHSYEQIINGTGEKFPHKPAKPQNIKYVSENTVLLILKKMNIKI